MSVITRIGRRRKVTQSLKPKKSIAGNKMKVGYFIFGHVANSVVLSLLNIFVQVFFFFMVASAQHRSAFCWVYCVELQSSHH